MIADIERTIANCELCIKYQNNQQREPMISHDILNERFLKISNLLAKKCRFNIVAFSQKVLL